MRIIAGRHKGRNLITLKGDTTRPSSDRMKEALFNQLGPFFDSGYFLDCFSGSGAVGLEAISRGMEHATLIEKDAQAFKIIKKNIEVLEVQNQTNLLRGDAKHILMTLKDKYDIIFMDPPYDYKGLESIMEISKNLLKQSGLLIVETHKDTVLSEVSGLIQYDQREYGLAKLHYYRMP